MKAYIVFEDEGMHVRAVFDTAEKAEDYVYNNQSDSEHERLEWEEYEVR